MEQLNVNWGKPYKTDSIWQRDWLIPQELRFNFFDYWKKNSFSLKAQGYSVTKKNEEWFLIETKARKLLFDAPLDVGTKHEELLETTPLKDPSGLRPWQVSAAEKICASIKKWGAAIDGSDVGCHAKGQPILMFDGTIKLVENIVVDDVIMGWNGPQKVTSLCFGNERMVKIVPIKGDSFTISPATARRG